MDGYSSVQIINIMDKIEKAANKANGMNRRCAKCTLNTIPKTRCTEEIWLVCRNAYVQGFKKGVEYSKNNNLK